MRILISNDDSIWSHGIKLLENIARQISDDIWVVAPDSQQSCAAHSLTLGVPLRIHKIDDRHYSVSGTPTDSVLMAMQVIMKDQKPDLVLSGINHGANLGEDIHYSGTVAAAMEGALFGIPAISLSAPYVGNGNINFTSVEKYGLDIIQHIIQDFPGPNIVVNVNFPKLDKVEGYKVTKQGIRTPSNNVTEAKDQFGGRCYWIGDREALRPDLEGTDYAAVSKGFISITPIHLDSTHYPSIDKLNKLNEIKCS